jgi:hypothetical protein
MPLESHLTEDLFLPKLLHSCIGEDGCKYKVNAFLDDISDSTYIRADIANALGLKIEEATLTISTLTRSNQEVESGLVSMVIESLDGGIRRKIGATRTLPSLCNDMSIVDWRKQKKKWTHLTEIDFPRVPGYSTIDILIGSDHPELEVIGNPGEPIARLTPLGWTCVGALQIPSEISNSCYGLARHTFPDKEMDVVESHAEQHFTKDEKVALEKAEMSRRKVRERYEIGIPWREATPNSTEQPRLG